MSIPRSTPSTVARAASRQNLLVRAFSTSFWAVFALASLARLAVATNLYLRAPLTVPALDTFELGRIAINLAAGRGFSSPFAMGSTPTAWMCPLVPMLYAVFVRVAGAATALWFIIPLQAVVGGCSAALCWLIFERLSARFPHLFTGWFLFALALVVSLSPESLYSIDVAYYYVWQEAALALFALAVINWWSAPSNRRSLLAGLAAGLLLLISMTPALVIAFSFASYLVLYRFRREAIRQTAVALLAAAVVIAPWTIRNAITMHSLILLRSNGGFEFFQGNNEVECIRQRVHARHPEVDPVERSLYTQLGEVRYCRMSMERAIQFVRLHPALTARRTAERIYLSWFTDLTDHWTPNPDHPWWTWPFQTRIRTAVSMFLAVVAAATFVWGILSGRFRRLPYAPLFASIVIFLPLPHFFTLADPSYTVTFRTWIAVLALAMLAVRPSASHPNPAKS